MGLLCTFDKFLNKGEFCSAIWEGCREIMASRTRYFENVGLFYLGKRSCG
jgi:hypothetical protein